MIGRNNSFFDGIYAILFNRDNELIDIVAKLAVYLVINMATAMFVMFWIFIAGLPRFIWTFGASWVRHRLHRLHRLYRLHRLHRKLGAPPFAPRHCSARVIRLRYAKWPR